jgi:hypothetical protein
MKELIECLKEKTPFTLDPSLTTIYLPIKEGPWMPLIDVLNNNDTLTCLSLSDLELGTYTAIYEALRVNQTLRKLSFFLRSIDFAKFALTDRGCSKNKCDRVTGN